MADKGDFGAMDIAKFMAHLEVESLDRPCPYCGADVAEMCKTARGSSHLARLANGAIPPTSLR